MSNSSELLQIENGISFGPGMGSINGTNIKEIRERLDSILVSPAGLAPLGSIGSRYNEGNRGQTYDHDPRTGKTVNSMGLPGIGIDLAEPLIREYSRKFADVGKLLIVGVSSLRGEDPSEVLPELMERIFEAGAVLGEANYSCPNIVTEGGGRKPILGYDIEAMEFTREAIIWRIGSDVAWQEKLPPYVGEYAQMIPEVAATYRTGRRLGRVGVTGFNTIPNITLERDGQPVLRIIADIDGKEVITHAGGLSGPAVADQYAALQAEFLSHMPADVPFIAAGGIWSGADVRARMADPQVEAAVGVSRYWEGEKAGLSFGRVATMTAEEYIEAA